MDNRDCPVSIVGTVFSLLPDPRQKIRTIWFDLRLQNSLKQKLHWSAIEKPSDSLSGLDPSYIFSYPVDAIPADFFRFETAAFELSEPG